MPGGLPIDVLAQTWLGPIVLVLARCMGLSVTAPAWGTPGLGWRFRLGLSAALTALLAPIVGPSSTVPVSATTDVLARGWLAELAVGMALGLAMGLVISAARQAGELIGVQMGLSTASLFDPEAGGDLTPLGHFHGLVALGAFLALDGPLRLVGALVESYRVIPAGGVPLSEETARLAFERVGWALALALRAAAPAALALVIAGLGLGFLARTGGSLQLASLTWPLRTLVGLVLVAIGLATVAGLFGDSWSALLP